MAVTTAKIETACWSNMLTGGSCDVVVICLFVGWLVGWCFFFVSRGGGQPLKLAHRLID
jgi:hypothetical protein